jgi:poly(3-hydroxybutyrate) depolymerase
MLIALALLLATTPFDRCVQVQSRKVCVQGPSARGLPLLIYLHGFGGAGSDDSLQLQQYMGKARVLYAAPDALPNRDGQNEWRTADLEFLKELIERLIVSEHADESRAYLAGFSLGGFLALDFACLHPDHVAALVSVSGTRSAPAAACVQGSVSTLHEHGEKDTTVNPAGGIGKRTGMAYLSARSAARRRGVIKDFVLSYVTHGKLNEQKPTFATTSPPIASCSITSVPTIWWLWPARRWAVCKDCNTPSAIRARWTR